MKKIKIFVLVLLILSLTACKQKNEEEISMYNNATVNAGFDTYISISVATTSQEKFDEYFNNLISDFKYLNQLFDIYNNYDGVNNIKTINDNAGIQPVEVDPIIIEMLELSKEYYDISDGQFDITLGPVLKIWHTYREEGLLLLEQGKLGSTPNIEDLIEANKCKGWDKVEINKENSTVYLNESCASLDVGAIAKGYATEYVAEKLEKENIKVGIVDAGGNNRTINTKLDGTPWNVGIQDPTGGSGSIIVVKSEGSKSFVTSGDYQRYYVSEDGKQYHHIIDPRTLFPSNYFHSVTVITEDSGVADVLSTTLYTVDFDTGNKIIEKFKKENPTQELEVIWIMDKDIDINTEYKKQHSGYLIAYTKDLQDSIVWN